MTFFLVIDLVLRIFPFFSHIFRIFTMLNVVYDHFLTRKPPFFTLFILSHTSDNTTSQNIGGTMHGPSPHLKFWGDRPPLPPPRSPALVSKLLGYNRCFGDRFFTPSRFCASIFCDRCFDDRCFLIAVINVHLNSEPRKNAPHIVTDTKVF